jgi:hypothetical protein
MNNPGTPLIAGTQRPGMVSAIAVLTLISGIVNIMAGLCISASLTATIILICLAPFGVLPIILGVFEILYAVKLLSNPPQPVRPNQTIAILEIVSFLFGNVTSGIIGVLALAFYSDLNVKAYFDSINSQA